METLPIIRGDDEQLKMVFTDNTTSTPVAIDLTGFTVFFTVKSVDDYLNTDIEAKISKRIETFTEEGDDPTNGIINILLTHEETNIEPGEYYWDCQLKSPTGLISSTQRGKFLVSDDTTRTVL